MFLIIVVRKHDEILKQYYQLLCMSCTRFDVHRFQSGIDLLAPNPVYLNEGKLTYQLCSRIMIFYCQLQILS